MKRDIELIRKLFFRLEEFPVSIRKDFDYNLNFNGCSKAKIDFHLNLMKEANFISGIIHRSVINKHISVYYDSLEITWDGYEFFDSIRDNKIWRNLKKTILKSEIPFNIIKDMARILITNILVKQIS